MRGLRAGVDGPWPPDGLCGQKRNGRTQFPSPRCRAGAGQRNPARDAGLCSNPPIWREGAAGLPLCGRRTGVMRAHLVTIVDELFSVGQREQRSQLRSPVASGSVPELLRLREGGVSGETHSRGRTVPAPLCGCAPWAGSGWLDGLSAAVRADRARTPRPRRPFASERDKGVPPRCRGGAAQGQNMPARIPPGRRH